MKQFITTSFALVIAASIYGFSTETSTPVKTSITSRDTASKPPEFKDGGKTAESLKREYNCETIEYENWEDDDATDSTLTVCMVNSTKLLAGDVEETSNQLQRIASQIKKALKYPGQYNSYYIIFVKKEGKGMMSFRSHTAGGIIPDNRL